MSQNFVNRLSYRKPLKNRKLGFFVKFYLTELGKRDGGNGTIRKDTTGYYTSPYFEEEINLCKVQIREEQERLENILLPLQSEIFNCNQRIVEKNTIMDYTDLPNDSEDTSVTCIMGDTAEGNSLYNLLEKIQKSSRIASIKQQKEELGASIKIIEDEKEQINTYIIKEKEITRLRCLQAYNLLIARLSAYWKGVLVTAPNNLDLLPMFKGKELFEDIQKIIDEKK